MVSYFELVLQEKLEIIFRLMLYWLSLMNTMAVSIIDKAKSILLTVIICKLLMIGCSLK